MSTYVISQWFVFGLHRGQFRALEPPCLHTPQGLAPAHLHMSLHSGVGLGLRRMQGCETSCALPPAPIVGPCFLATQWKYFHTLSVCPSKTWKRSLTRLIKEIFFSVHGQPFSELGATMSMYVSVLASHHDYSHLRALTHHVYLHLRTSSHHIYFLLRALSHNI